MNFLSALRGIGLSESDANVYLAILKGGPSTVLQIAEGSGLTRQMIYHILPSLLQKGLIKSVLVKKTRRYQVVDLAALRDFAEEASKAIINILPELKRLTPEQNPKATVQIYSNTLSMREWYRRFIKEATPKDELLVLATNRVWIKTDEVYLKKFIDFKNRLGIRDKIIAPDTDASRSYAKSMNQPNAEYRFLKKAWGDDVEKWIWKNTVSLLTTIDHQAQLIVVESAALASMERAEFLATWRTLPT